MIAPLEWLDPDWAVELHDEILDRYEGTPGLLSRDSLAGALAHPRQYEAYLLGSDIGMLAASLRAGLIQDHAFLDGNKRTALDATVLWLAINGYVLSAPENVDDVIVAVAERQLDMNALAARLADWIEPLPEP